MESPRQSFIDINEITKEVRWRVEQQLSSKSDLSGAVADRVPVTGLESIHPSVTRPPLQFTRVLDQAVASGGVLVGNLPQTAATSGGRLRSLPKKAVRRLLSWYTQQIQDFQQHVTAVFREQAAAIESLGGEIDFLTVQVAYAAQNHASDQATIRTMRMEIDELKRAISDSAKRKIPGRDELR